MITNIPQDLSHSFQDQKITFLSEPSNTIQSSTHSTLLISPSGPTWYFPGSFIIISITSSLVIVYPRMATSSGTSSPSGISSTVHPLFRTTKPSTVTSQSCPVRMTSAPSKSKFFTFKPSPSNTNVDCFVILPPSIFCTTSCCVIANPGQITMRGPGVTGMPPMGTRSSSSVTSTSTPANLSLRWFCMYLSDSAEDIVPGAFPPLLASSTPASKEFLAGLKVNHLSNWVKPMLASLPISF
mmetsp:Transcript_18394/g.38485  ORF Transcript_18394/g.38485 Transcript_18394/m.38485 type:complete len:240 (+) Transcript_18394:92-811(+)